jgi:putative two-component system response regulator
LTPRSGDPEIGFPMPLALQRTARRVPPRALALSVAALLVPMAGGLLFTDSLGQYGPLLWLVALVPAFLLAYYRGWRGVATALASGMAALSLTQVVANWMGLGVPDLLLGIVVAYVTIALGIGWLAENLLRERDQVEDMAFTDILTHLPNRRHARAFLENEFAAAERGRMLSVALFDLDDFKAFNDKHGHQAGDEALRNFADILTRTTRRMNLSARFGGEEFLSVLAGSDAEGAMVFADRVRTAMYARKLHGESISVSGGVALFHPTMRSPDELLAAADHALYQAKRDGRNCVRLFGHAPLERGAPIGPPAEPPPAVEDLEYPRAAEDVGRTRPPSSLMPHQVTAFGAGRRVLLVEDEQQVRLLIASYLNREGFAVAEAGNVGDGVRNLGEEFDVVVTDIRLPGASGNELVAAVKSRWPATQVIVITGLQDAQVAAEALNAGADRYLFKPFGMPELRAHLSDALGRRDRLLAERTEKRLLTNEARARAEQAREAVLKGARALVRAVEVRDPYTRGHSDRVARFAVIVAEAMNGEQRRFELDSIKLACELHDVGKIGIPDAILNKEGPLSPEEFQHVRKHPRTGRRILEPLLDDETVLSVVSWHHERWDGSGYPDGLAGESIPLPARLVGVADALDAMTSDRAYRRALGWEETLQQMRELAGKQFDPGMVDCVHREQPRLRAIWLEHTRTGM